MRETAEKVAALLRGAGVTLSVAESCSGGLLAKSLTDLPGASAYFLFGAVTYANSAKERVLGVLPEMLDSYGAVSAEVAEAMAKGVRTLSGSDLALSTTGIAGPDGGSIEKPVGTVFIALSAKDGGSMARKSFAGTRENIREATVIAALELLYEYLFQQQRKSM